jgi:hypothetical protein
MLKYGNPPALEDCVDIGTCPPDLALGKVENRGVFAGSSVVFNLEGANIPPHRIAWIVVAYYRYRDEVPKPYTVVIQGLGRLVYSMENGVDNWQILPN